MASAATDARVGALLREWRQRRRVSQFDVALEAGISARHLSFVETGRSKPGREMLLRVLEQLQVPLREQNEVLLAAGHAPAFPERPLDDAELQPVRDALDSILTRHEPYPAIVVDRAWNIVAANAPATALVALAGVDPALLEPPVNAVRVGLHPRGLAPLIVDLAGWRAFWRERLEQQLALSGDAAVAGVLEELNGYPQADGGHISPRATGGVLGPLRLRPPGGGELSFIAIFATFDTPFEVTTSELALELIFPADRATTDLLESVAREGRTEGGAQ